MIALGFDTETFPIRPGRQAPRVVCGQARAAGRILLRDPFLDLLEGWLADPSIVLHGFNVAFDACATIATRPRLLGLWLEAYESDRVTCDYEREKLIRIARGDLPRYKKNDLLSVVNRYKIPHDFQEGDKSGEGPRTRYYELDGIDPASWPEEARRYAWADTVVDDLHAAQNAYARPEWLRNEFAQARSAFALSVISAWGMRTDPRTVHAFGEALEAEHAEIRARLTEAGLVRPIGSKDTKAAARLMVATCERLGLPIPMTDKGRELVANGADRETTARQFPSLDADATASTGDPILKAYSRFTSIGTLRGRVERLRMAAEWGIPIQPRFDNLKETGRTSCSSGDTKPGRPLLAFGDQTQNPHRSPGLRECYVARPGCVILSSDWKAAELHTLAQCAIDLGLRSRMAEVLNSGRDVHLWFGARMAGWSYDHALEASKGKRGPEAKDLAKKYRQGAKAANFGFPGGLGIEKFRMFAAKTYDVILTQAEATDLRRQWLDAFPEMSDYFAHVAELTEAGRPLIHFRSGRYRGDVHYTSAANSYFQGRCADMAKEALWLSVRSGLPKRDWNFAHDEILTECRIEDLDAVAAGMVSIMERAGRIWCPDVPPKAEPAAQFRWRKGAEPFYRDGHLRPWEERPWTEEEIKKGGKLLDNGKSSIQVSWELGREENDTCERLGCKPTPDRPTI